MVRVEWRMVLELIYGGGLKGCQSSRIPGQLPIRQKKTHSFLGERALKVRLGCFSL